MIHIIYYINKIHLLSKLVIIIRFRWFQNNLYFADADNIRYFIFLSDTDVESDREQSLKMNADISI